MNQRVSFLQVLDYGVDLAVTDKEAVGWLEAAAN